MKILVLNCGSSSLKYQLIDMGNEDALAKGLVERIGIEGSRIVHEAAGKDKFTLETAMQSHSEAIGHVMDALTDSEHGVIRSMDEINAVGHRVVHGGEKFAASVIIDDKVKEAIVECAELAPLHNPPNLTGIKAAEELMPGKPQVAVFDTAFHQTMPDKAYMYAIPMDLYRKYKIRRYGFHGTSHRYVSEMAAGLLGRPVTGLKMVTCHLGNGASVCAIDGGVSVDTSMGFTPLEGLIMGTRSGDIDPAVVQFVMDKEGVDAKGAIDILNKKSGVLGISGVSSDFRDIEDAASKGNAQASLALESFCYRVAKYVGGYAAAMNGVDAVVFTAGLGENGKLVREKICGYLGYLGLEADLEKNNVRGKLVDFGTPGSKVRPLIVPTNEELVIARDTKALLVKKS
ncbi:MAG: acetate kinase [Defluviitaleaceae bacterium]|nr:acetate kinase [Defluviitaleaceae bacterium]MCL2837222.1 acetate kinase [Defluviitaleaceae bacterium]